MKTSFSTILKLAEYEIWCNEQCFAYLENFSEEELRKEIDFGLKTLHCTLFHILNVMRSWSHCVGPTIQKPTPLEYNEKSPLSELKKQFVQIGEQFINAIHQSYEQELLANDRRLHQVFHLVTHGTHHRGQLLSMLTLLGHQHPFEGGDFGGWSSQFS